MDGIIKSVKMECEGLEQKVDEVFSDIKFSEPGKFLAEAQTKSRSLAKMHVENDTVYGDYNKITSVIKQEQCKLEIKREQNVQTLEQKILLLVEELKQANLTIASQQNDIKSKDQALISYNVKIDVLISEAKTAEQTYQKSIDVLKEKMQLMQKAHDVEIEQYKDAVVKFKEVDAQKDEKVKNLQEIVDRFKKLE